MDEFNSENKAEKEVDSVPVEPQQGTNSVEGESQPNTFVSNNMANANNQYNATVSNDLGTQQANIYGYNQQPQNANRGYGNQNYYNPPTYYAPPKSESTSKDEYLNEEQNTEPKKDNKKDKKKSNKAFIAILMIFVIGAITALGVVVYYATKNAIDTDSGSDTKQTTDAPDLSGDNGEVLLQDSQEVAKQDSNGNLTAAGVVEKAIDSCVGIMVYTQSDPYSFIYGSDNSTSDGYSKSGEGSGVFMSEADGVTYVMTCAHVVEGGEKFVIKSNDGQEHDATLVGYDSQTDIGVLKIAKTGFKIAEFGESENIKVGEECIAIGCPGGLEFMNSATKGIISALARPISSKIGYNNKCIQTDTPINPGNSGGALFNMQGQVIGINSSKIADTSFEGMGFSVPSKTAVDIANSLILNGYVAGRAKLGVNYNSISNYTNAQNVLAVLAQKGYKDANGTMVIQSIEPNSGLNNKGIQKYDMIVAVNGETMTSVDVMTNLLSQHKPGDTIKLTIARANGNTLDMFEVDCVLIESR